MKIDSIVFDKGSIIIFFAIQMSHLVVSTRILSDWRTILNMSTSAANIFR